MKKRILSALLALVMVLALLPATAFAADWTTVSGDNSPVSATYPKTATDSTAMPYYVKDANNRVTKTVTVTRCTAGNPTTGQEYGKWYWQDNQGGNSQSPTYKEVQSGIVAGTSGSGQWYADVTDYSTAVSGGGEKVRGAFTVLGTGVNLNLATYKDTSLTLAIANSTASLTIPANLNTLTIEGKFQATPGGVAGKAQVGAISTSRGTQAASGAGTNSGLNITATNANITSINLAGRANTLRLTDCTVGAITMDGETITTVGGSTPNSWGAQTVNATRSTIASIAITNSNGGGVTLQDSTVTNTVGFTSDGGNIQVSGASSTGVITVTPRTKTGSYAPVRITGGNVAGVTQGSVAGNDKAISITVSGTNTKFGDINAPVNGTVNITDADGTSVTVAKGSLTIGGTGVNITGDVTLAGLDKTTLSMGASNSTFGGIKGNNKLTINSWNGKRQSEGGNDYGVLALDTYDGKKVTGGTFTGPANATAFGAETCLPWLDTANLQFFAAVDANKYALYTKSELARAISDVGNAKAITGNDITVLAQADGKQSIVLMNGKSTLAKIGYNSTTPLILPMNIDNIGISTWIATSNHNVTIPAGTETNVPFISGSDIVLNATGTSTAVSKITKATTTASVNGAPVVNQNVTVTLSGNNINVSGAVTPNAGGIATVYVDLETDVVQDDGSYLVLSGVIIDYNVNTKKASFNIIQPAVATEAGALVQDGALVLNYGTGERYTVSANLAVSASRLGIVDEGDVADKIVVTFGGKLSSWTAKQKEELTEKLTGANSKFGYGVNQAMQQAINAAQATITSNNSVESWITNAKNTIWRQGFKSPDTTQNVNYGYVENMAPHTGNFNINTTDGGVIATAFDKAFIVPYLLVNVTDYDSAGTMTATLTPSFRVDVSASGGYNANKAYTVQTGRALTLTGDMTNEPVEVKFDLGANFATKYLHQDGKYVYTGTDNTWKITHLGANGTLGTIVINSTPGYVSIADTKVTNGPDPIANRAPALDELDCKYDTLQAAIDDTVRGKSVLNDNTVDSFQSETMDTVVIDGKYTGSCAITMNGMSRNVYVVGNGLQDVTCNTTGVDVQFQGGYRYLIQMKQDVVAAGTVAIAVNGTAAGTATVSTTSAKAGQTVTVTVVPNAGQSAKGVTVKTNTGSTINATSTGVANQYSFTVPTGVTSITVTPNFGVAGQAIVSVNNNNNGSATVAGNAGTVAQGSTVTVYTTPKAGYRATSVSVRFSNGTTVNATSTGTNTWTFTVPANATTVTITPNFSVDTGLPFLDVPSTEYYLPYVRFVYNHGMMKGDGNDYTFNGNGQITRGQIVTILYRLQNSPTVALNTSFRDVPANEYYAYPVAWAAANGIVNGRSSSSFDPNAAITRQELAAILYRYNTFRGLSSGNLSNLSQFTDRGYVDNYAQTPMQWAVGNGIITGTSTNTLSPNGTATRYQAATMLTRYCQTFLKMV